MTAAPPLGVLLEGAAADHSLLGGKGASLDQLVGWGLPVPPTGVVTTEAYRAVAADPGVAGLVDRIQRGEEIDAAQLDAEFDRAARASGLREQIGALALRVGGPGGRLAVRSSATVEDLASSSFAGQYTSVLDVPADDADAVLVAVGRVFASLWHPAPCAYRRAFGIGSEDIAMAAVLMAMVPAQRAGVVFTVDPGGGPGAARIEVVEGLAESLVSGERTPEPHVVDRDDPPADLPPELATALALALEVEARTGLPQDVEWAWDGTATLVVQARPITVGVGAEGEDDGDGFDSPPTDDELTTAAIGETLPGVLAPLVWQVSSHLVDDAFQRVLDDLAALPADGPGGSLVRRVRGRAALDFSRMRAMADALPGGAGEDLEQQYFGSRRPGRPAAGASGRRSSRRVAVQHDLRVLTTRRRVVQDADTAVHAAGLVLAAAPPLAEVDAASLLAYRARLSDLAARAMADELAVAAIAVSAFSRLEGLLAPHLGPDGAAVAAEQLTARAGVTATVEPSASAAVFAGPTWEELGRSPVAASPGPDGAGPVTGEDERLVDATDRLLDALAATSSWGREGLRHHVRVTAMRRTVGDVVAQLRRRERTKAAVLALGGEVRRVHLELGRRLTERGVLDVASDVDLLSDGELRSAWEGRADAVPAPTKVVVAQRRRWLLRYESEGPLPARFTGVPERSVPQLPEGDRLEGWASSAGRASATAQVVHDPAEGLVPGRVLVAEATDASWAPLFVDAAAIVLERGGPLSHAAILSRELGVPAVLNVQGATRLLDGRLVTVDGDAGVVVLDHDEAPS